MLACLALRQHLSCQHQHTLLVACLATSLCICNGSQRFTEDDHREGEEERVAESITLWWCWAGNWSDIVLRESAGGRCASSRGYLQVNELYKWIWNYNFKVKKKKNCAALTTIILCFLPFFVCVAVVVVTNAAPCVVKLPCKHNNSKINNSFAPHAYDNIRQNLRMDSLKIVWVSAAFHLKVMCIRIDQNQMNKMKPAEYHPSLSPFLHMLKHIRGRRNNSCSLFSVGLRLVQG